MIKPAIRAILIANQGVIALVGDRVFIDRAPQNEHRTRVVIHGISTTDFHHFDGNSGWHDGLVQVDCFGADPKVASEIGAAVASALDDYYGTISQTNIEWLEVSDTRDIPSEPLDGDSQPLFGVSVDVEFAYND